MRKKILSRINIALGSAIFALVGMNSCERQLLYGPDPVVKYGCPPDTTVVALYGVNMPVEEPPFTDTNE